MDKYINTSGFIPSESKPSENDSQETKAEFRAISDRKKTAARENLKKANAARAALSNKDATPAPGGNP